MRHTRTKNRLGADVNGHRFVRVTSKLFLLFVAREKGCSLVKAVADVWRGHKRPARRKQVFRRMRLLRTDSDGLELWETPLGEFWAPPGGGLDIVLGEMQDAIYRSRRGAVEVGPGQIVFDCGAHVGVFSRHALAAGASQVIAVEITPITRTCLERNLDQEILQGRVLTVSDGVWDRETVLDLSIHQGSLSNTVVELRRDLLPAGQPRTVRVPVTTIDRLVERLGLARVDFIKMDIEGAERYALRGASQTLQLWQPRLAIASYHLPDDREEIRSSVMDARPDYTESFGACLVLHGRLSPETLFYH